MKILTSNYCPECDQFVYIKLHNNENNVAQSVYLDRQGVLCVYYKDEESEPDYECVLCGWTA